MQTFRCRYRDSKDSWHVKEEHFRASDEQRAFEQFVQHRKKEHWTLPEIFIHSQVEIISEVNNDVFILDSFGEVKKPHTTIPG